jgi:hypothetical protein
MEMNRIKYWLNDSAPICLALILVVLSNEIISAQKNYTYMIGFLEPCVMLDKYIENWIIPDRRIGRLHRSDELSMVLPRSLADMNISIETKTDCDENQTRESALLDLYDFEDGEELMSTQSVECEGYNFVLGLYRENYCTSDGKTARYLYKAICDTLVDDLYNVRFWIISKTTLQPEKLLNNLKRDLRCMKHIHLISSDNVVDFEKEFEYPARAVKKLSEKAAQHDRHDLAKHIAEYYAGIDFAPLQGLTGKEYYAEIEALVLQGKDKEALDRYYSYKLHEYALNEFLLKEELALCNVSLSEFYRLRKKFDRNEYSREELASYLDNPNSAGEIFRLSRIDRALNLFESNDVFLYRIVTSPSATNGLANWSEDVALKLLQKEDSICDFADCSVFDFLPLTPHSMEDMHYLYFPDSSLKRNNTYLVKFQRKSFRDNSYEQDWIRLPLSLQPDDVVSREVYNNWIFLSTKDTTYVVHMDYENDDDSLNFLNYKFIAIPQAGLTDTNFRFICNDAYQLPGMFAFKRNIETRNWTMTDSSTVLDFIDFSGVSYYYEDSHSHDNPGIVAAARKSDPSCVLYKKKFSLRDLNHDRCNEYYRYSISNGELIDVLCYSFVNNVMRELPREEAIELIKMEADYKALELYTRMGWE